MAFEPDSVVDTFGLLCPMPIIKAGAEVRKMNEGQVLEVIATDPGAVTDIKDWCKANRHSYLGDNQEGRVFRIWLRKGLSVA